MRARAIREIVRDYQALLRDKEREVYYPVALVGAFPLDDIPENWAELAFPPAREDST